MDYPPFIFPENSMNPEDYFQVHTKGRKNKTCSSLRRASFVLFYSSTILKCVSFIYLWEHVTKRMHPQLQLPRKNPSSPKRTCLWLPWLIGQLYDQGLVVLLSISELSLHLPLVFIAKHLWALAIPEELLIMDLQVSYYFLVIFLTHCFQLKWGRREFWRKQQVEKVYDQLITQEQTNTPI